MELHRLKNELNNIDFINNTNIINIINKNLLDLLVQTKKLVNYDIFANDNYWGCLMYELYNMLNNNRNNKLNYYDKIEELYVELLQEFISSNTNIYEYYKDPYINDKLSYIYYCDDNNI